MYDKASCGDGIIDASFLREILLFTKILQRTSQRSEWKLL